MGIRTSNNLKLKRASTGGTVPQSVAPSLPEPTPDSDRRRIVREGIAVWTFNDFKTLGNAKLQELSTVGLRWTSICWNW